MSASIIERIQGSTVVVRGDDVDTDRIVPARFLRVVTFEGLDAHVFEDDRQEAARNGRVHPFDDPARREARVLLVEHNFGCGSSREHAPQAIYRRGIRAIVGTSFAEIFFGNAVAIGLACVTVTPEAMLALRTEADRAATAVATVDLVTMAVTIAGVRVPATMPASGRASFVDGTWDVTSLLLDRYDQVERVARRLPYMSGFISPSS